MKRFLTFIIVLVVSVSFGFTVYTFIQNNEKIVLKNANIYVNVGDAVEINFDVENKKKQTKYTFVCDDIASLNTTKTANIFDPIAGGEYKIDVTTTNNNYSDFTVTVMVGDGTEKYPFYVKNANDLTSIGSEERPITSSYKLANNIDMSGVNFPGINEFSGTFNGENLKITNWTLGNKNTVYYGNDIALFHNINEGAVVSNFTMENTNIYCDALRVANIAIVNNGTITNVGVTSSTINNLKSSALTSGLAIYNNTVDTFARLDRVYANVNITANGNVAGLLCENNGGIVVNSYAMGDILTESIASKVSGLVILNKYKSSNKVATVQNCYSTVKLPANVSSKASLIVSNINSSEKDNIIIGLYYVQSLSNTTNGVLGLEEADYTFKAISESDIKDLSKLVSYFSTTEKIVNWNSEIWSTSSSNNGFPKINFSAPVFADDYIYVAVGNEIATAESLIEFCNNATSNDSYLITADIDLAGYADWTPLDKFNGKLSAGFDEENDRYYSINNLTITTSNDNNGLFSSIGRTGVISNLRFDNVNIAGGVNSAVVAGENYGVINNIEIIGENSVINAKESGNTYVGGIVADNLGSILNCDVNIQINVNKNTTGIIYAGGIAGINRCSIYLSDSSAIINSKNCFNAYIGGITGGNTATINSAIFDGEITAGINNKEIYVGGITGYAYGDSSTIIKSTTDSVLEGYNVGGLIALAQKVTISECAIYGTYTGQEVGAVASECSVIVLDNVYTETELIGIADNSRKAGIAVLLPNNEGKSEESFIGRIFMSNTFTGVGDNFVTSYCVTKVAWPWEWNPDGAPVKNAIFDVTVSSNAKRWVLSDGLIDILNDDGANSTYDCMGGGSNAFSIYTSKGFNASIWDFEENSYPTLINVRKIIIE